MCALGGYNFFPGCSSETSDTEKQEVEEKSNAKIESTDQSESILSLFADSSSSNEPSVPVNKENEFFLHNSPNVSNATGGFPERADLMEWLVLLKAKNKHEVITFLGMPDSTYNTGTVFCYNRKLRNEPSNDLHLAFHSETLMVEKIGWDAQSLQLIETYSEQQ